MIRLGLAIALSAFGVATGAAALSPCAAIAAETPLTELVEQLGSDEHNERYQAYLALRRRADPKTPALLATRLPEFPIACHYYGVLILDGFDDKRVEKPLRKLLKCPSPYLRVCAALQLHGRGAKGMAKTMARELTAEELPPEIWLKIMKRLRGGRVPKDASVMRALLDPIVVGSDSAAIREIAAVMNDADARAAVPTFEALLEDERAGTRAVAAAFLRARGQDRDADLAAALRGTELASGDVYMLDQILTRRDAAPVPPIVVEALIVASRAEANSSALRAIVQVLGQLSDESALPRLRELTAHKHKSIAKAAARAIEKLSGTKTGTSSSATSSLEPTDTVALTKMTQERDQAALGAWLHDGDSKRRLAAADALRRMDDHSGLDVVLAECTSTEVTDRREAVRAAGQFRVDAAVETLITAMLDEDSTVRNYARSGLNATLLTLLPHRGFRLTARGEPDTPESRTKHVARLRAWWPKARDAAW